MIVTDPGKLGNFALLRSLLKFTLEIVDENPAEPLRVMLHNSVVVVAAEGRTNKKAILQMTAASHSCGI
jgi:hypothetical protein